MKRSLFVIIFGIYMVESRSIKITPLVKRSDIPGSTYKQVDADLVMNDTATFDDIRKKLELSLNENIVRMRIILGGRKTPDIIQSENYYDTLGSHIPGNVALLEIIKYKTSEYN